MHRLDMQFEVLATCNTTRARVSRMKLPRESEGAELRALLRLSVQTA
jgi:hypothetical protein